MFLMKQFSASFPYEWFKYITFRLCHSFAFLLHVQNTYKITILNFRHVFVCGLRSPDSVIVSYTLNNRM